MNTHINIADSKIKDAEQITKTKIKTNKVNLAETIIKNHTYHDLIANFIDDIVDNYTSFKPSIYTKLDDWLYYNYIFLKIHNW